MSVTFTTEGTSHQQVVAISLKELPAGVTGYVKKHYKNTKIAEAGKVTDAKDITMYEKEVDGKDLLFDEKGNFI